MMLIRRSKIGRKFYNMIRYKQIISILIKHGFQDFIEHSKLPFGITFYKKKDSDNQPREIRSHWERIRMAIEDLGPTFVKLGQFLSNRPDLIPADLCAELEKLLENVSVSDTFQAREIFEKSLNVKINDVFEEFSDEPFSSASIAQVHKAKLKDGTIVAVKIQRQAIRSVIESDIDIMMHLAGLIRKHVHGSEVINPVGIVEEFRDGIFHELDFSREAMNIDKFSRIYSNDKNLVVPKLYKTLCNKEIITMEYIAGNKFTDYRGTDEDIEHICKNLANMVLRQIFENGYFHADPHSGNIIVTEEEKICFIDFGLMGLLPPKHKESLCDIIIGLVNHDPEIITRAILSLSYNKDINNRNEIENQVFKIMEQYGYLPLEDINIGHFLRDLLRLLVMNKLNVPTDIFLLLKSVIALEGTIRKARPSFDMISTMEPFVKKMVYQSKSPYSFMKSIYKSGLDYSKLIAELPSEIREIFAQLKHKTLKIQFEHKGLEPMLEKHVQIVNRLSFSIVTSAMLIGSALILRSKVPPTFHEVSILGILVFIFSVFMALLLIISILRHGKM